MSSVVQQQEYSSGDPPHWFGYDSNGTPLGDSDIIVKDSYSSEEEANYLQPKARKHKM
jgi:F-box/leucine-rich repeat protein 13